MYTTNTKKCCYSKKTLTQKKAEDIFPAFLRPRLGWNERGKQGKGVHTLAFC